jgi:ribosome biogenesis GTPase A
MEPYWNLVEQIICESDIVLEILDARLVALSRNAKLEELIKKIDRPRIFVINKVDLVEDRRNLEIAVDKLKEETKADVVYVTVKDRKTIKTLLGKIRQTFDKYGKKTTHLNEPLIERPYRKAKGDVIIGVIGYPNVGKSTIINSLAFKKKMKVSKTAGTTHGVHWINAANNVKLIDTPGVIPLEKTDETRLGMIAARNPERIKEPDVVAIKLIDMFMKENKLDRIEKFYNITLKEHDNPADVLEAIGKQRHFLRKGGVVDELRASLLLVNDWQDGKLRI